MPGTNQLADPASFREWVRERVRYSDTDMQGHVNNLAYMAYAETGRSLLLSTGPIAATLAASGGGTPRATFLLARVEVDFLGETRWPGEVDIGTRVERLGRTSVTLGQGIFSAGACKAVTRATLVLIDLATRKPTPIEGATREALAALGDVAASESEPSPKATTMEPIKPMEPMKPMAPMKPMQGMSPMRPVEQWWPGDLGTPSSAGGQNDMRYAFFPQAKRLVIDTAGNVAIYDTGNHDINGVSQQHGDGTHLAFSSQDGEVRLETLTKVS